MKWLGKPSKHIKHRVQIDHLCIMEKWKRKLYELTHFFKNKCKSHADLCSTETKHCNGFISMSPILGLGFCNGKMTAEVKPRHHVKLNICSYHKVKNHTTAWVEIRAATLMWRRGSYMRFSCLCNRFNKRKGFLGCGSWHSPKGQQECLPPLLWTYLNDISPVPYHTIKLITYLCLHPHMFTKIWYCPTAGSIDADEKTWSQSQTH